MPSPPNTSAPTLNSPPTASAPTLHLPTPLDDLVTLYEKMNDIAAAVRADESVARLMGFTLPVTPLKKRSSEEAAFAAEVHARSQFTQAEQMAYDDYKKGRLKPEPIVDRDMPVDTAGMLNPFAAEEDERVVEAVNEIWQKECPTAAHAVRLTNRDATLVPLLDAVLKVQKARRAALTQGRASRRGMAEEMAVQLIDTAAEQAVQSHKVIFNTRIQAIEDAREALRHHLDRQRATSSSHAANGKKQSQDDCEHEDSSSESESDGA